MAEQPSADVSLGVVFRPQHPPEALRGAVRAAEDSGLDELWLWEDCFLESGVATLSAALAWSERLRVGVGLLPVPLRNAAVAAMEAATVHRLFPGRATIAVGHGVQPWMAQVGAGAGSPMTLLREYTLALRALLAGERVTTEGRYVRLDGVALDYPPPSPAPVLVGARGPRTVRLTGEVADGIVIDFGTSPEQVRALRALVAEGQAAAGRTDAPHRTVVYLRVGSADGAEGAGDYGVPADAVAVADAVREFAEAGADSVVLVPGADQGTPDRTIRFAAERVAPLLR